MDEIQELCRQHQVATLYAFGSTVKGDVRSTSDVDLVLELKNTDPFAFSDNFWALEEKLATLFGRRVDLISRRAMRNAYFIAAVESEKVKLYEA
jgi:predicted nucleotidyltransferase